jgi:two-component system, cell cycle sensor histidine kinase and response regulator CckA
MSDTQRILIAEDEPVAAMKLQYVLEHGGFEVRTAGSAEEALELLPAFAPDMLITDVIMPGMSGFDLCRKIREDDRHRNIIVVLLTSLTEPADVLLGLSVGADNFFAKPFDSQELLERIRHMLMPQYRRHRGEQAEGIEMSYRGKPYLFTANRLQVLNFFVNIYETQLHHQADLESTRDELATLSRNLERMVEERTAELTAEVQERRLAEQRVAEQAALLDLANDAIIVTQVSGEAIYWNKSAEKLYGWTAEEASGRLIPMLVAGGDTAVDAPAFGVVRGGAAWSGEVVHHAKGGGEFTVLSSWTPVLDADGTVKSILMIDTDITQRKLLETKFLRTQRLESIGTLARGIGHDLNNVLSPILLAMNLLRNSVKDDSSRQMLSLVEESARRGSEMVKQVMMLGRGVEGARMILQPRHLMRDIRAIIEQSFPKNIQIEVVMPGILPLVSGDASQLQQMILNLCVNARDAMPMGGTLTISADDMQLDAQYAALNPDAVPGRYVLLKFADTGVGIPPELHEKIFDPFYTTKKVGQGTGLGLSTAVGIVRSHKGFMRVQSEVGKGTTFEVYLPAADKEVQAEPAPSTAQGRPGRGETILVVDDEHIVREITKATLIDNGYNVLTAKDGLEALALYAQHRDSIACVLIDLIMPYLDGPSTVRALQRMNPDVKVIACSGLNTEEKRAGMRLLGEIPMLEKPFTASALLVKLGEAFGVEVAA